MLDYTNLDPDLKKKLLEIEARSPVNQQLRTLKDIADMTQEVILLLDHQKEAGDKTTTNFGALLMDIRDSLAALKSKEDLKIPDYAQPVVKAVENLSSEVTKQLAKIDVRPNITVDAPQVNVDSPSVNVDLKGVEAAVSKIPKAFADAIKLIPEPEVVNNQPLVDALQGISEQLLSIENATRIKFSPGAIRINNSTSSPVPIIAPTAIPVAISSGNPTTISATHTDTSPTAQNITVIDSGSATTTGANAQSIVIGTPTAGSAAFFVLSGHATIRIEVSGIWTGTLIAEQSIDGGTIWVSLGIHQSSYTTSSFTAGFVGGASVSGATNFRMRATAAITGTAIVKVTESVNPQSMYIANAAPSGNVISTNNSSTANLLSGATFTGVSEDVSNFAEMRITITASHASATDGLSIQQSTDNTNWDITDTYTIPAATGKTYVVPRQAKWFRIVYTNGGTNTTYVRLSSLLNRMGTEPSSQRASDGYSNENDLQEVWAFESHFNGITWDRRRGNTTGALIAAGTTTTQTNISLPTYNANKLAIVLNVSAFTSGSVTIAINALTSSSYVYNLLTGVAVAATGTTTYRIFPGATPSANAVANDIIPGTVRITATASGTLTYGVDYVLGT